METTMTLRDVAIAAGVTRQAVTNWRRRPMVHGAPVPFPAPVGSVRGVEHFDRDEVIRWLSLTGRGTNGQAALDAPALTPPDGTVLDEVVALLALRSQTDRDLAELAPDDLARLGRHVDPQDRMLATEIAAIDPSPELLGYVDELLAASFGPSDALDRLASSRLSRQRAERALSEDAATLLGAVATACREHLGDGALAVDVPHDALQAVCRDALVVEPSDRTARRLLAIRGNDTTSSAKSVVHVAAILGRDDDVLDRVDDIADELASGSVGVILGPSSVLCDRLRGHDAERRRSTLAVGNLVAAVRLPRGMWRHAHRQALGLWVLRAGKSAHRILLADLTGREIEIDDVVDDVIGALEQSDRRQYRYGRALPYDRAAAGDPLVPAGMAPARLPGAATGHRGAVTAATLVTSAPLDGFDLLVTPAEAELATAPRSLGQMIDERTARRINGSRIDATHTEPTATVRVMSAMATDADWFIDPLVAAQHYDHARRTEPSDVVVTATPRPHAVVDDIGGSLVRYPSFIVRLAERAAIGPRAFAESINQLPDQAGEWRAWSIPRLAPNQVEDVEATLVAAETYLRELRRREAAAHDLVRHLVQGVAVGDLALVSTTPRKAG